MHRVVGILRLKRFKTNLNMTYLRTRRESFYHSNLSNEEKEELNKWGNSMNHPNNKPKLRIQDKGNGFIFVSKQTDREKANVQINRSNFRLIDHDPTPDHIKIVKEFVSKWSRFHQITSAW